MRIAICTDIYLPQLSGVSDSLEILVQELIRRGHAVRLYAPALPGAVLDPNIVRLRSFAVPGSGGGLALVLPFGAMSDIQGFAPDVIHTNTASTAGIFAWYASRTLRVPLVGTDHTFPADYLHYAKLNFPPFPYLVRKWSAWYYQRCDFVTAPSQSMLDELARYNMTRPSQVISNHIPTDAFRPLQNKDELKKKYGIEKKVILIFGRIALEKNLDRALEIVSGVMKKIDAELVFIGDGPYREMLVTHVKTLGLEGRTRFLGVLRGEVLTEAINACEVFLITSTSETQSMTTLQAMACELPVVAINAGGLPEYVQNNKNGYVVAGDDTKMFEERLLELLTDAPRAQTLGAQGRRDVARFSPKRITEQFLALYQSEIN